MTRYLTHDEFERLVAERAVCHRSSLPAPWPKPFEWSPERRRIVAERIGELRRLLWPAEKFEVMLAERISAARLAQ